MIIPAIAWAIAAHIGSTGEGNPDFNTAVGIGPLAAAIAMLLARCRPWPLRFACSLGLLAGLAIYWPTLRQNSSLLYVIEHVGINLALAAFFGRTLMGQGEALVTRLDRLIFPGGISPLKVRYTRHVTLAWTIFFTANASISALLFACAPIVTWSIFANLLGLPLFGTMFLGEYLWRRQVLPPEERPSIEQIRHAWQHHTTQSRV